MTTTASAPLRGRARLTAAFARPGFQLVILIWLSMLTQFFFFPLPKAFNIDIHVYSQALANMLAGEPAYLVADPVATAISDGRAIYFFPPPIAAIVGGVVGLLPAGGVLWLAVSITVVALAFVLMRRVTPSVPEFQSIVPPRLRLALPLLGWFLFEPSFQQIFYGNQQGMILLGTVLMVIGLTTDRPWMTGLGLGSAVLLKASPILFVLPLLVARRWADVGWTLVVCLVGGLASLAIVGVTPWFDFLKALASASDLVATQGYNMAPLARLLPAVPSVVWIGAMAVSMALAGRLPVRPMIVVCIAIFLLGWPVQWLHYSVIALPAMVLLLADRRTWLAVAASYILFQVYWWMAWLPASLLLIVAAIKPEWTGRAQAMVGRFISPIPRSAGQPALAATDRPAGLGRGSR